MMGTETKKRNPGFFGRLGAAFKGREPARDPDPLPSVLERLDQGLRDLPRVLSERMEAALGSLADSLRADRGERAEWEKALKESELRFQAVSDAHLARTREAFAALAKTWDDAAQGQLAKIEAGLAGVSNAFATGWKEIRSGSESHFKAGGDALLQGLGAARESLTAMSAEAAQRLRDSAAQAEASLQKLSDAAGKMHDAAQDARRMGEDSSAHQAGLKAAVEMLNQGLTGVLDRLQSFASLAQGQEALLEKMEAAIRRFEERSAEMLEDNALKIQESFLDALEKAEGEARGA